MWAEFGRTRKVAFVETWFGVKVEFKPYYLGVRIPPSYESNVAGLCGNYDCDANNDYRLINGDVLNGDKEGICKHIDAWVVPKAIPKLVALTLIVIQAAKLRKLAEF